MPARPITPFLWLLFSAGGTIAALLYPVHLVVTGLLVPLGWIAAPGYGPLHALVAHPLTRLYLFVIVALPLVHWAHRFRYTLYDGLQLKHLNALVAVLCYGTALVAAAFAAWALATFE